jgi:hypothetical protein
VNRFQRLRLSRGGFPLVTVALAAVALTAVLVNNSASAVGPTYSNGFESNTDGWLNAFGGTITREASGFTNPGGYASTVPSATGGFHARFDRTSESCFEETGGGGPTVQCPGPLTRWGGYNSTWPAGGYTTQLDIYLDAAYATANPDTYGGNMACLLPPGNAAEPTCKGTRFDYSSAINNDNGTHLRDFGFNVSTGLAGDDCPGFTVIGTTNVDRIGADPNGPGHECIPTSGWYTFRHTFSEDAGSGSLKVLMEIIPASGGPATASWTISGIDPIGTLGCNRYGWFSNQEIWGLPIDNASMTGCGTPPPVVVDPPTVIVLPPAGTGPPKPGGPPAEKVADEIITRMKQNQLRSCVIEVRSLGSRRILVARGAARAPATGTGRLVIRLRIKPTGTKLLTKNFGGVIVNVRALCRTTSGVTRVGVKGARAVLWIEHALTPPGSWVPDQPTLTDIGLRFMQRLRSHMRFVRLIRCEGYTATYPPSPAFPPTLSLNRANRVCSELRRTAGSTSARVKLVPHGLTNPIASNSNEAGRRINRRVFVTVVHFRVLRG